jgi:ribosomal protein L11 methyltransferase
MPKTYLEISIPADSARQELLIPFLLEIGCHGFLETESSLLAYLDKAALTADQLANLRYRLSGALLPLDAGSSLTIREIPEENWNLQWEQSITPVEIGSRVLIKPSWQNVPDTAGKIVIEIDPKMSFGTGHHETTRLCLRLLEQFVKQGDRVLDVGTGTGLLAIAALKLGAESAVGIDIDDWSIENALENVKANGVGKSIRILRMPIEDFRGERFECILANLTHRMILDSLAHLRELSEENGIVIISGFLQSDLPAIRESLRGHRFHEAGGLDEHGWSALALRKV